MNNAPELQDIQNTLDIYGMSDEDFKKALRKQAKIQLAKDNYYDYIRYTFPNYVGSKHLRVMANHLDRWISGEIPRLLICTPPRHGKSEQVSRRLPGRIFGRIPTATIIAVSYTFDIHLLPIIICKFLFVIYFFQF